MPENIRQAQTRRRTGLAQRRKAVGLTQEQLAEALQVDPTTVARWERGDTQPLPWLRPRLARTLKVSPDRIETLLAIRSAPAPRPDGLVPVVPRQLPAEAPGFTGRTSELAELTRLLDEAAAQPGGSGAVVISAIGGTAGVGKTALALHWAHRAAPRFRDGQLHVNLRGFDPTGTPLATETAIRGFLHALGVPPERIPAQPDAQAGLYRSLLADREMLIVLDNARDEQQVRPLLPASPGSLVLVTSRSQLSGLAAADDARLLTLDVLGRAEAVQLLAARIGAARTTADPAAVDEIARRCGHLPLALAVVAARAAARPGFPLGTLAAELRDEADRLDALDAGDPATSVRAVFSGSYRQLSPGAARLFRLLGLHPGPDISVPAAASLTAASVPATRRLLRELTRAHLIDEHVPGRYALHDLLGAYAADQAYEADTHADRREAIGRVLDHYLHTASRAAAQLDPALEFAVPTAAAPGTEPAPTADASQALEWFEAEHRVLLAAFILSGSSGLDSSTWQLPWAMARFRENRGYYEEWTAAHGPALADAARLIDIAARAACDNGFGLDCPDLLEYGRVTVGPSQQIA